MVRSESEGLPLGELDDILDSVDNLDTTAIVNKTDTRLISLSSEREWQRGAHSPVCSQPSLSMSLAVFAGSCR